MIFLSANLQTLIIPTDSIQPTKCSVSEFQYSSLTAKKIFNAQTAHDKIKSIEFQFKKKNIPWIRIYIIFQTKFKDKPELEVQSTISSSVVQILKPIITQIIHSD